MNGKTKLFLVSLSFLLLISGCTTPIINEVKLKDEGYVSYDQNAIINFNLYNPAETSFNGKVEIQATEATGYFNCFEGNIGKNLTTILPKKSLNGDIELPSKKNEKCKNYDLNIFFVLKDANSNEALSQTKLTLKIKQ